MTYRTDNPAKPRLDAAERERLYRIASAARDSTDPSAAARIDSKDVGLMLIAMEGLEVAVPASSSSDYIVARFAYDTERLAGKSAKIGPTVTAPRADAIVEDDYVFRPSARRASPYVPPGGFVPGAKRVDVEPEYSGPSNVPTDAFVASVEQNGSPNQESDASVEARRRLTFAMSEALTDCAAAMKMNGAGGSPPPSAVINRAKEIVAAGGPAGYQPLVTKNPYRAR